MSNWGDDIKKLSTHNNNPTKMEVDLAQNVFSNGKTPLLENPHLRVAIIASLLFIFLNLNVVNDTLIKITKKDTITKIVLTIIVFIIVFATSYYHNEV
jgi:hypothetical protein